MATAGFPIIGTTTVWGNWDSFGSSAWNMWFMAPYGSWAYCGFVKSNVTYFKKVYIGTSDADYEISTWDFGLATNTPEDIFLYEQNEGYPNGSMGMGCIRGATPTLYLAGRSSAAVNIDDAIIYKFPVNDDFERDGAGLVPRNTGNTATLSVDHICGIEVDQGNAVYIVTNNNDLNQFMLRRYAYTFAGNLAPATELALSPNYLENNSAARIRGIALASDGHVLIFANTGESSTSCKVFKFHKDTLAYLGVASWSPNISTSTWAYLVAQGEVFLHFQGLDSASSLNQRTAVYYDRATGIPDESKSNFIINDNLTIFGSDDPIELTYVARDAFNIAIPSVNAKFVIDGEDPDDETTWTDRVGGIQLLSGADFFDADGVPLEISAIAATDVDGVATAYYKPMRAGTGTERDTIKVTCPSDN
jgi:hypothetical protein